jgi:hypothetical protein
VQYRVPVEHDSCNDSHPEEETPSKEHKRVEPGEWPPFRKVLKTLLDHVPGERERIPEARDSNGRSMTDIAKAEQTLRSRILHSVEIRPGSAVMSCVFECADIEQPQYRNAKRVSSFVSLNLAVSVRRGDRCLAWVQAASHTGRFSALFHPRCTVAPEFSDQFKANILLIDVLSLCLSALCH